MKRLPSVAIVGRPNVGKSRLFNRMVGSRKAIVDDMPGVTRDRIYGVVEEGDHAYRIIDTGGFEPDTTDEMLILMREQACLAIEESDLILFMMDGREGLTPNDMEIGHILRQTKQPVIYIVNKIDGPELIDKLIPEFYGLGVDELLPLSAEHCLGVADLTDKIAEFLPKRKPEPDDDDVIGIAVIGRPNVGKSTIINRILGEERVITSSTAGTTRDAIDSYITRDGKKYCIIDTAGIRRKSKISYRIEKYGIVRAIDSVERSDIVLLLIDAVEGVTEQDIKIAGIAHNRGKGVIVVVNKWDLVDKDDRTSGKMAQDLKVRFKFMSYISIIFVSALSGKRVVKIFPLIEEISKQLISRVATGQLNRLLEHIIRTRSFPVYRNRRLRLYFLTQVAIKPPTFVVSANYPEGFHFSTKRYISNQIREELKLTHVPIRVFYRKR